MVPSTINPGGSQKFTIAGDPKILTGKVIQLTARWNGGSAKINSIIPKLTGNNTVEEDTVKIQISTKVDVNNAKNLNQDPIEEESVIPESNKEENDSEET